ncbi:arylesterase [Rheinheimera sp. F8]|uniref:arylesterase n=1 Tax=Rheinheimera sp. F8 TaxID=1763998 RepID=UPI0007449DBB|nr:arylesterase [Rheinheimera sp. F8]ALZ74982.1 arylesterase [Rheinheimera sp. F8]ALZ76592.1 arylesterase [Rheinheimera sp. F8]
MRFYFLICALWTFACLPISADAATKTLMIVGDSLSAGYGLQQPQSWPALLQRSLEQKNSSWRIQNASISGETSGGALARLPALLQQHKPTAVLIEIGGNDGLRGFPISRLRQNLQQLIELTKSVGATPVLMQIRIPPNYGPRYTEQFVNVYAELAAQHQLKLWPFFMDNIAVRPELMQADGIHPNVKAQPIIRDFVLPFIEEM